MIDLLGWLKWPEFHLLNDELRERLGRYNKPVIETAYADRSQLNEAPRGPMGVGITSERILVVEATGSFTRKSGEALINDSLSSATVLFLPKAMGLRRRMVIDVPGRTLELLFAPLWYHEVNTLQRSIRGGSS